MRKLCWLCGGSGAFTCLCGIRRIEDIEIDVITTIFDSGGGQGVILAGDPEAIALADPMKCVVALAEDNFIARLYRHRFAEMGGNGLSLQTVGNVIWYGMLKMGLSPREAITYMHKMLSVQPHHRVEPVASERADVCVRLEDGSVIRGEAKIDVPQHDGSLRITETWLEPRVKTTPEVVRAIVQADIVVIGPGDLYSSLVPCLLPEGVSQALQHTRARLVYVASLMTKFGETFNFRVSDFVGVVEQYAGRQMDYIICNTQVPSDTALSAYEEEHSIPVENDLQHDPRVIESNLLDESRDHVLRHSSTHMGILLATLADAESRKYGPGSATTTIG